MREARFAPGALLASRFRIVSLLGTGGMGQVYRAEDVKLGQGVALKYIPSQVERDVLERLYAEVRIGRQVSHPNVCRLYDIVEIEGAHFIAMEYVDGEDLASLLRRIGRLPGEKALSVARDICAGLAAAHDRGVVHRDLKPANVMVDGRGIARITDFGLAALSEELAELREFAGTPAYMSPEQLAGGEVTMRSDIYALGVVLYELFTGRRLYDGRTITEIRDQHSSTKHRPSSVVDGIDPAVERLILRCLEENAALRPASMQAVIAALPGGDPLQAAVDAGETPSPGMVAAAGRVGDLSPRAAWTALAGVALLLALATFVHGVAYLEGYVGRPKSREALEDRSRELLRTLTGAPEPVDSDYRLTGFSNYVNHLARGPRSALRSAVPAPNAFIYRESPEPLVPSATSGRITAFDPPPVIPGMATVHLDAAGRLLTLARVPPQRVPPRGPTAPVDWTAAIDAAGLDVSSLSPVQPEWTPSVGFDRRYAWTARYAARPDVAVRVEAASFQDARVWFAVLGPWERPRTATVLRPALGTTIVTILGIVGLLVGAAFARRNLQLGRGDRKGAYRIALFAGGAALIALLSVADHVSVLAPEWGLISRMVGLAMFDGTMCWVFYLAVEPYVRRRWPHMLISWSRLAAGRLRDPLVGRDFLLGALAGTVSALVSMSEPLVGNAFGISVPLPSTINHASMENPMGFAYIAQHAHTAITFALGWLVIYSILQRILRNDVVTLTTFWLVMALATVANRFHLEYPVGLVAMGVLVLLLRRVGVFALAVAFFFVYVIQRAPLTTDFSQWYAVRSTATLMLLGGLALFAFHISLGGKRAFGTALEEDSASN